MGVNIDDLKTFGVEIKKGNLIYKGRETLFQSRAYSVFKHVVGFLLHQRVLLTCGTNIIFLG